MVITVRNEVAKVMFLQVSVCPQGGLGVSASVHAGIPPPEQTPPWSRHPPEPTPQEQTPQEQTPPSRHPPGADTPPPPEQTPPPGNLFVLRTSELRRDRSISG